MTTMIERRPTSPSELQHDLHQIASHNAQSEWLQDGSFMHQSHANSSFNSPAMMHPSLSPFAGDSYMSQPFVAGQYSDYNPPQGIGLGVQYTGVDEHHAEYLPAGSNGYTELAYTHEEAPMTPASSNSGGGRRTRNGRSVARSDSPQVLKGETNGARVSKPARQKKPKAGKAANSKTPKLEGPLSELTKDMTEIPVRDMEEWVNRSDEVRQKEVEKRDGYVTRPMNSFMLYRSAYAERTKQWCLQNNHQIVSSVSGESWPLEPPQVRDHYNELAKTERANHAKAHPSYKFSPSKTPSAAKKKKGDLSDEEEDYQSSSGDPDWEYRPRGERRSKGPPRRQGREAGFPAYMSPQVDFHDAHFGVSGGMGNAPSWTMGNDGRQLPNPMGSTGLLEQMYPYAPQSGFASHATGTPVSYQQGLMPVSVPQAQPSELPHANNETPVSADGQVDPMLLQVQGGDLFSQSHNGPDLFSISGEEMRFDANGTGDGMGGDPFGGSGEFHGSAFDEWMGPDGRS